MSVDLLLEGGDQAEQRRSRSDDGLQGELDVEWRAHRRASDHLIPPLSGIEVLRKGKWETSHFPDLPEEALQRN